MARFLIYKRLSTYLLFLKRLFIVLEQTAEVLFMQLSKNEHYTGISSCPNLLEWTGCGSSFCRLRYMVPEVLTSSEIVDYCRNINHTRCVFYIQQVDMISQNNMVRGK